MTSGGEEKDEKLISKQNKNGKILHYLCYVDLDV